jgi:F-type H+-transporting ATPase subunit delta
MAELVTIARPYAEAVFKLARENNALAAWSDALANLDAVVGNEHVQSRISDPNVSAQQLEGLVLGVIGDKFDSAVAGAARNFVQVLVSNNRLELTPQIRGLFESLKREQEGTLEATIISAHAMSAGDAEVKSLVAALEAKYKRKVTAKVETDASLIGGVKIVVGDKVIDATVRGKLDAMAAALAH